MEIYGKQNFLIISYEAKKVMLAEMKKKAAEEVSNQKK